MTQTRIKILLFTLWGTAVCLATVIGTIPGLLTFVFLGGSILDFRYVFLAAVFLASSLAVSYWLRKLRFIENLAEKG